MKWLEKHLSQLSVWSVITLAFILRLPQLDGSFWLDEAAQALESIRPLSQQFDIVKDFQPPLLHLVLHFIAIFSHAEWWFRLWGALLPGLVTIYFLYRIAEHLFSKQVAALSTILLATSSFHIFYSQELRPYSLSAAVAVVSWWLLVKVFNLQAQLNWRWMALYVLVTATGLYSTYLYPFVIISQFGYVLWQQRSHIGRYILSLIAACAIFIPWLPMFLAQLHEGQALRDTLPGWEAVVSIPQLKSLPLTLGKFMFGVLNIEVNLAFLALTLLFVISVAVAGWQVYNQDKKWWSGNSVRLVICWLVIPLITSWLISFAVPVVQPKRVLYLLPAFYLLIAALAVQATQQAWLQNVWKKVTAVFKQTPYLRLELAGIFSIGILLVLNVVSTFQYYTNPNYQRENWRAIQQIIISQYPTDTAVVFGFDAAFAPWEWYDDGSYPVFATGNLSQAQPGTAEEQLKKASEYSYILVFDYLRDLTDPGRSIESALHNLGYSEKDAFALPGIGFVRVFARQEDALS